MKAFPWVLGVLAGLGLGFAAYYLLHRAGSQNGIGSDDADTAARKISGWGTKQRAAGAGGKLAGKLKEGLGRVTGNEDLAAEGLADQASGTVRDATGALAHAAGQTIHDLSNEIG
ncbi:MAG: CsbD family protein [Silvibacterium sp.]